MSESEALESAWKEFELDVGFYAQHMSFSCGFEAGMEYARGNP